MLVRARGLTAICIAAMALALTACASLPTPSSNMKLGAATLAPVGFIEMCQRDPQQCPSTDEPSNSARADVAAVGAPLATAAVATPQPQSQQPSLYWKAVFQAQHAKERALPATRRQDGALAMNKTLWTLANRINSRINTTLQPRSDMEVHGLFDVWSLPLSAGLTYGDCEDFALEKRAALINAGVPASALSMAVVYTPTLQTHAVLVLTTDQGEYVLDSLAPAILPWAQTDFIWVSREVDGDAFRWAQVKAEDAHPADRLASEVLAASRLRDPLPSREIEAAAPVAAQPRPDRAWRRALARFTLADAGA